MPFFAYLRVYLHRHNREFCSCSLSEISTVSLNEDEANAHVDAFEEPPLDGSFGRVSTN